MKKLILIVWGWDESVSGKELKPWLTNETASALWLANIKDDIKKIASIITSIKSWHEYQILIFLHETEPHSYRRHDQEKLYQSLGSAAVNVRSRLFGAGKGSVYFGKNCRNGIIGMNGRLAETYQEDPLSDDVRAEFILDEDRRIISQKHFDYVWNAYWHQPSEVIFRMAERFNRQARGFQRKENDTEHFLGHLAQDTTLWHQLHSFAGISLDGGSPVDTAALEYNLDAYIAQFSESGSAELVDELENARSGIKNLLQTGTFEGEDQTKTVSTVYNKLFGLHDNIVGYDPTKK